LQIPAEPTSRQTPSSRVENSEPNLEISEAVPAASSRRLHVLRTYCRVATTPWMDPMQRHHDSLQLAKPNLRVHSYRAPLSQPINGPPIPTIDLVDVAGRVATTEVMIAFRGKSRTKTYQSRQYNLTIRRGMHLTGTN
jgi:hypothetical protein